MQIYVYSNVIIVHNYEVELFGKSSHGLKQQHIGPTGLQITTELVHVKPAIKTWLTPVIHVVACQALGCSSRGRGVWELGVSK